MKLSNIIQYVLIGLTVIFCFYLSIEVVVAVKNELPVSLFSYSISYVPTNSMEDEIMPGDYVLFKKTDFSKVNENDVIVYKSKSDDMYGKFIIHRVIEEHEDYFITKGDNNPLPDDEVITSDMVIGKYICVIGFMKGLSDNKTLFIVILFVVIISLFGSQIVTNYLKKKREEIKENNELEKQALLEQLRKEILEEELEKIRNKK